MKGGLLLLRPKAIMFSIGCSFHVFSIFRYNYLISVVGTSRDSYMWTASVVSLVSFFISNAWLWIAQRRRKLFATFLLSAAVASLSLLAIPRIPSQAIWLRAAFFCLFFGCLKSFISIGACATIKNIPDRKVYGEQFVFFLIGTVPVNFIFSHLKLPDTALTWIWIVATGCCLWVCWVLGGSEYFDKEEDSLIPELLPTLPPQNRIQEAPPSSSNDNTPFLGGKEDSPKKVMVKEDSLPLPSGIPVYREGYLALFSNANYRFFIFIAFLIGYACNTFIIFAPKLQQEDLGLSNSQRTTIEYVGMASEIVIYLSFRHFFGTLRPYVLLMVCMGAFFLRALFYVLAVFVGLLRPGGASDVSFGLMLAGDSTKGFIFGMLQPAYIAFVSWYSCSGNRNIALAVYNGVFYGLTGFACGIASGIAKLQLGRMLKDDKSLSGRFFCSNSSAFVIAQGLLVIAMILVGFRYWVQGKGRHPEFSSGMNVAH